MNIVYFFCKNPHFHSIGRCQKDPKGGSLKFASEGRKTLKILKRASTPHKMSSTVKQGRKKIGTAVPAVLRKVGV